MADLAITLNSVFQGADASISRERVAGEAVIAGKVVYRKSDGKWWLARHDGTLAEANVGGIPLHPASAGQPLAVQTSGAVTMTASLAVGVFYYLSATPGGICPVADLGTGDRVTLIGYGATATSLVLSRLATGLVLA